MSLFDQPPKLTSTLPQLHVRFLPPRAPMNPTLLLFSALVLGLAAIIALFVFAGCSYSGPKIALHVGFMGAEVGAEIGGQPPQAIALPPVASLKK